MELDASGTFSGMEKQTNPDSLMEQPRKFALLWSVIMAVGYLISEAIREGFGGIGESEAIGAMLRFLFCFFAMWGGLTAWNRYAARRKASISSEARQSTVPQHSR